MAERAQVIVRGVVQGVGFRPFIYRLAKRNGLFGSVTNTAEGVLIDVEGRSLAAFLEALRAEAPPLARITGISVTFLPFAGYQEFVITESRELGSAAPFTLVSPDTAVCADCLRELLDPGDRRYLYPFINCTNCGPRYTITKQVPYDRPNTTMASFALCRECNAEYHDPDDRRFHAQPNACSKCGPQVEFKVQSPQFTVQGHDALRSAIEVLRQGGIVAVKGLGGFHIACDATNDRAVRSLRERKRKSNKPFAVMCPDIPTAREFCVLSPGESEVLSSSVRPIVLLEKYNGERLSVAVSPGNRYVGVMLPYTPLHHLLFSYPTEKKVKEDVHLKALVMTSGNLAEEPIVRDNDEAEEKLSGLVDAFLFHNRGIFMRVDDSVVRVRSADSGVDYDSKGSERISLHAGLQFIRRSRGYAPEPVPLHEEGPEVLGCGADIKNTFTLTKGAFAIPSQHIGDMENYETLRFYEECLENLKQVYRVEPVAIVHDLHPGYLSTRWAKEHVQGNKEQSGLHIFGIQHHYAHIGAVMADHRITGRVIAVALDGTGYGTDGNLWGSEFLLADIDGFDRAGQFAYIPLPGGEAAIREPWRTAVSFIDRAAGKDCHVMLEQIGFTERYGKETIDSVLKVGRSSELSPLACGAGRLFDAVSALLGVCDRNTFEGEAAMALESLVREGIEEDYPVDIQEDTSYTIVDFCSTIRSMIDDVTAGLELGTMSTKFHNTVSTVIVNVVANLSKKENILDVLLSGGTFQNLYLLDRVTKILNAAGLKVYTNRSMPCNDACISLGQAYIVRERLKKTGVRSQEINPSEFYFS